MVNQSYPRVLQLNKAIALDTEPPFMDLHLSVSSVFVSTMTSAMILNLTWYIFSFFDSDVPRRPSYGV